MSIENGAKLLTKMLVNYEHRKWGYVGVKHCSEVSPLKLSNIDPTFVHICTQKKVSVLIKTQKRRISATDNKHLYASY